MVRIKNLSYRYPDGTAALSGINLEIQQGEKVGLIGENGAGKTTFLLHLNGLLKGDGEVWVCGMDVHNGNLKAVRQKVGLVFQNPDDQLFCPTIFEDIAFGPRNLGLSEHEVSERVRESLKRVGLEGFEEKSALKISSGEKKRAAIATVLSMRPEILVLDEPTSNLDPRRRRELTELLKQMSGTQLIASHNLNLVKDLCGRVVIFFEGKIVSDGPAAVLLKDEGLLAKYGLK